MNKITQISLFLIFALSIASCKQTQLEILKTELDVNTLFVLNDNFVILNPQHFLKNIENSALLKYEVSDSISMKYKNSYTSIIKVYTDSTSQTAFNESKWIEYRFIENVNPNKEMFYMLDGMPIHLYSSAKGYLTNRIITKLNFIPPNHAIAIWGNREGKNGATQIWTEKNENEIIVPVIIK